MSQWFKFGEFSAYPFEDGVETNEAVAAIVDAAVIVKAPIRVGLSRFNVSGATADIVVVNFADPSEIVATTANVVAVFTTYGAYGVYTVDDPVTGCIVRIVVLGTAPVIAFVGLIPFAAVIHDVVDVVSLNGLRGDVVLNLPAEMTAEQLDTGEVVITSVSPAERGPAASACNPVLTINGTSPGDNGAFAIGSEAENNHRVRVVDDIIQITNFGVPCCTCKDYYNVFNTLAQYDAELATSTETLVTGLINKYHELVRRWWTYTVNTPVIDVAALSTTPLVAAGLWGNPVSRAVYGIMRMTAGSYSVATALMVANAAWYPVSLQITVTSSVSIGKRKGTIRSPSNNSDFDGFPGTIALMLEPGENAEIESETIDAALAGLEVVFTATVTVTPLDGGQPPPKYLSAPTGTGSFSMTVRGTPEGSASIINSGTT